MRVAATITLSDSDKRILKKNTKSRAVPIRLAERSKIVLLAAEGLENKVIAQRLNIPPNKVGKWRNRFAEGGMESISKDKPRGANHKGKTHQSRPDFEKGSLRKRRGKNQTMQRIGPRGHWLKH